MFHVPNGSLAVGFCAAWENVLITTGNDLESSFFGLISMTWMVHSLVATISFDESASTAVRFERGKRGEIAWEKPVLHTWSEDHAERWLY